jgi:predicted nucleic acid-binding protein
VIVLDTPVLIDGLTGLKRSAPAIRESLAEGERMLLPALVLYDWLRGPRLAQELAAQEALFRRGRLFLLDLKRPPSAPIFIASSSAP